MSGSVCLLNSHRKLVKLARYLLIGFLPTIIICAGLLFICPLTSSIYYPQDVTAIDARYNQMYAAVRNSDYETAYGCMSPTYRRTNSVEDFQDGYFFSKGFLHTLHPKRSVTISFDRGSATLYPNRYDFFDFYVGPVYELVKVDGEWYFTGKSDFIMD